MRPQFNKADTANPAMEPLFNAGHQWRGVADPRRYVLRLL